MENIAQNEIMNLEILESRLEMESMTTLPTDSVNSIGSHCSILTPA